MRLSEAGVKRVRGYLFVVERGLQSRLPKDEARHAVRAIERHLNTRVEAAEARGDELLALERILAELGAPQRVAQAYSADKNLEVAVKTGRIVPILRSIAHVAFGTVFGFIAALFLFVGYVTSAAFFVIGIAKPFFPDNVGIWRVNGPVSIPTSLGFRWDTTEAPAGGNWVILIGLLGGLILLGLTHLGARAFLSWYRARRRPEFPLLT
jgi:uncharacterized membrane protein